MNAYWVAASLTLELVHGLLLGWSATHPGAAISAPQRTRWE